MRVLYVLNSFPKLSETFVLNEIVELKNRNIDVEILALKDPHEAVINHDVIESNLLDATRYFLPSQSSNLRFPYFLSPGFHATLLSSFYNYRASHSLTHLIRLSYYSYHYRNIDLIHAHFAFDAAIIAMQMSKLLQKPFTFTAHAYELFNKNYHSKARLNLLAASARRIFTPSEFNKKYIITETNTPEDKIEIIRATISLEKFRENESRQAKGKRIRILGVGRLVEKKGFEYIIRAMKIVTARHETVELVIIGEGKLKNELVQLSLDLGLDSKIKFLGARSNEECIRELSNSDIAVLPCVVAENGDMDVCPLSLQEAMAMEIPVVSTRIGSIPELIEDGKEGVLVRERDEKALAEAILGLIENPALRNEMGRNGRAKTVREFNQSIQADKLIGSWRNILDNERVPS